MPALFIQALEEAGFRSRHFLVSLRTSSRSGELTPDNYLGSLMLYGFRKKDPVDLRRRRK
jgi:hypothetical protein